MKIVRLQPRAGPSMLGGMHLDLDGAWPTGALASAPVNLREWGPKLRFCALPGEIAEFQAVCAGLPGEEAFLLYGSGDFHHLSALWVARAARCPLTLVSFDNHPDWDLRPPRWCCGNWMNRALDLPRVEKIAVWGCGNFECWGVHRLWGNHGDVRRGRLEVHPWADGRSPADQARAHVILAENWRERFEVFAAGLAGKEIYVTVDLDCLRAGEAVTNWENGRFAVVDVCWAIETLRSHGAVVAGDICGAYSAQGYARWKQCFAANLDHPKFPAPDPVEAARINARALAAIWPVLTGAGG